MKYILSLIISGALIVSGFGQTRNVLVNTNNAVVQPTNFWSADASNARTGLGLGSAATNSESAFQAASSVLTNISLSNGGDLTNIQAASIVGIIPASNISSINLTNIGGLLPVASGGTGATNAADARTNLGATSVGSALFTASSASNARTALLLGSAATNNSSDFQPADSDLTNLAANNAINLTNFPTLLLRTNGNGSGLTSLTAANINGIVGLASNVSGVVAIVNGGTGSTNASNARTALGLGTAATNNVGAFVASSSVMTNLSSSNAVNLTNLQATNIVGQIPASNISSVELSNVSGALAISNGGTGATNAATARTNLGLGWSALTNSNASTFLLGFNNFGEIVYTLTNPITFTNKVQFNVGTNFVSIESFATGVGYYHNGSNVWRVFTNDFEFSQPNAVRNNLGVGTNSVVQFGQVSATNLEGGSMLLGAGSGGAIQKITTLNSIFATTYFIGNVGGTITNWTAPIARTNLGLPWSGLTNTNAATFQAALFGTNTNPVLVNTNGEVVSPTNFWQAAPIVTRFVESEPNTNSSTNIAPARNLHIHSSSTNIVNVTNTIVLPTNGATFDGDIALVVHQGPTNSMTKVRAAGSTNDLVTMTRFDEAVEFVYYDNVWQFNHNKSFIEPIYFSGTNAAANAAASRTNLGLGATNDVTFGSVVANGAEVSSFAEVNIGNLNAAESLFGLTNTTTINESGISFSTNTIAAATRTNLGLGATNNVTFSNVTASGTLTATGTVTATTNLVVNGFVDFSTNHTNSNPATNNQIQKFLQIRIGTNAFFLPLYQ